MSNSRVEEPIGRNSGYFRMGGGHRMKLFISHSFEDEHRYDDFCLALEQRKLDYWNPKAMRGGTSLRDQLRAAILDCPVCVFLATQTSVSSGWCLAELGAFWGSGKKVIIYVADDALADEDIPKQFAGDIWFRKMRDVLREVDLSIDEEKQKNNRREQNASSATRLSDISVGTFIDLLRVGFVGTGQKPPFSDTMDRLYVLIASKTKKGGVAGVAAEPDFAAILQPHLMHLIGESIESLKSFGRGVWPSRLGVSTSTGKWGGFAADLSTYSGGEVEVYSGCLLIHTSSGRIDSVAVVDVVSEIGVERPVRLSIGTVIVRAGDILPGTLQSIGAFEF